MIILQGSSRSDGNTKKVSDQIIRISNAEFIDLGDHELSEFSYDGPGNDGFQSVVEELLRHEEIVFITPIYWYTMSGRMKTFFDRITDLLKWKKELGRKLRTKKMFVVSSSMSDDAPEHFAYPFEMSANYLGMEFTGYVHTWIEEGKVTEVSLQRLHGLFA